MWYVADIREVEPFRHRPESHASLSRIPLAKLRAADLGCITTGAACQGGHGHARYQVKIFGPDFRPHPAKHGRNAPARYNKSLANAFEIGQGAAKVPQTPSR